LEMGDLENASESYVSARIIYRALQDQEGLLLIAQDLVDIYTEQKKFDKVIECYFEIISNGKGVLSEIAIGEAYSKLGEIYFNINEYDKAVYYYDIGQRIFQEQNNKAGVAYASMGLASVYEKLGNTENEIQAYQEAQGAIESLESPQDFAWIYISIGNCYSRMGKKQQAIQNYNIAQPLFKSQQDTEGLISVYRNLAMAYTELGDRMRAANLVITAILLAKKIGDAQTIEDLETLHQAIDEYND